MHACRSTLEDPTGLGAGAVATGHYAAVEPRAGRTALRVPADRRKDQTYVLFPLSQRALSRAMFPLAAMTKDETRALAARRGLPVAEKPESMELCFVPGGDYREVLAARAPAALVPGDVLDEESGAVLGRHAGVGSVTVGQRRGVGVANGTPRYVTGVDVARNVVLAGRADALLRRSVRVEGWNAVSAASPAQGSTLRGRAKVRRNHEPQDAELTPDGEPGTMRVHFGEPVRAPAPGQALVLYDEDGYVLGGGWIASSEP